MDEQAVRDIVVRLLTDKPGDMTVPVEVSARHVHLCQKDMEMLFGTGYRLTKKRELSQPGEFLCEERIRLVTGKSELNDVAVLGPVRTHTQVELSATDARLLGINAPLRLSGNLTGAADVLLMNGGNYADARGSAIVAQAHIHMLPEDALRFGVVNRQSVRVAVSGERPLIFENVIARVSEKSSLAMHIDFDEANACMLHKAGAAGFILQERDARPAATSAFAGKKSALQETPDTYGAGFDSEEKLITEAEALKLCKAGKTALRLRRGTIMTALAIDALRKAGISYIIE